MIRCTECGDRIIVVDGHYTHPSCDPVDPDAAKIRDMHAAQQRALAGGNLAADNRPDEYSIGLSILNAAALSMQVVSANDCRELDARWEKLDGHTRASVFRTAARKGWLEKVGHEVSTSDRTNAAEVKTWSSRIFVGEFAVAGGLVGATQTQDGAA